MSIQLEEDGSEKQAQRFIQDSRKFMKEFDSIAEDLFQGEKLEKLALNFIRNNLHFMKKHPFPFSDIDLDGASTNELVKDDFRILNLDETDEEWEKPTSEIEKLLAQIYSRACQASYLRLTCNKARKKLEEDRQVPVKWARKAIRYDPHDFQVVYWFMIAIGWQLDGMGSSKELVVLSQVFKLSILRCIKLNPEDALAHHLLGRYFYNVGNLTWLERTVIKTMVMHDKSGQFKIEGSHAEAEQQFLRAHSLRDDWPPTGLWMARALLAQNRPKHEVAKWIEMGLAHPCKEPTTEIERQELLELKAKLKL